MLTRFENCGSLDNVRKKQFNTERKSIMANNNIPEGYERELTPEEKIERQILTENFKTATKSVFDGLANTSKAAQEIAKNDPRLGLLMAIAIVEALQGLQGLAALYQGAASAQAGLAEEEALAKTAPYVN